MLILVFVTGIAAAQTTGYRQLPLTCRFECDGGHLSDKLVTPWGIAFLPGQNFVLAENGIGRVDSYDSTGELKSGLSIPLPPGSPLGMSQPTAVVADPDMNFTRFRVRFQFFVATEEGTIVGFTGDNGQLGQASIVVDESRSAVFTGLALLHPTCCNPKLAVANFHDARIEVYGLDLTDLPGAFEDPNLPAGYAPYNIQTIGNQVFVTYAKQDEARRNPVFRPGNGIVSIFDQDGNFVRRFISEGGKLDAPWAITASSAHFGLFANEILIGNVGDSTINAYDPATGNFIAQLTDSEGNLFVNPTLRGMAFRNDGIGNPDALYFTSGADGGIASFSFIGVGLLTNTFVTAPDTQSGGTINITVEVTPATGDAIVPGTVAFSDDGVLIGTVDMINGVAILSHTFVDLGVHVVSAEYLGSGLDFLPSIGRTHVTVFGTATTTTLSAPGNVPAGVPVTFRATTQSAFGRPTGSITFLDGPNELGTVPLDLAGSASLTVHSLGAGVHPVTAAYSGNLDSSTSPTVLVTVGPGFMLTSLSPCRVVDTRTSGSPIRAGTSQNFTIPELGGCNIPTTATAYSLNVTVVPRGGLGFLTIWPTAQSRPVASTLNSLDGRIKASAAIVPAGLNGAVSVFASNTTDVILDINGYFSTSGDQFYKLTPCRVIDTRAGNGNLSGPHLTGGEKRDFPVLESTCLPRGADAKAYSMNFTVAPHLSGQPLGFLTVWPQGNDRPLASTLNNLTATIVANAALVPAGRGGGVSVFPSSDTDLVVDINGYFAPPGQGGLSFYPATPCRVLDTRQTGDGEPFVGQRTIDITNSACAPSNTAQAYIFTTTVVPAEPLGFVTLWPDGQGRPLVSTLNAIDGAITSNLAIVPTANGSIDAFASDLTQLILDISGYFSP